MISPDDVGTIALRLGRAFQQQWAAGAPKGVPWNWRLAAFYARTGVSTRKPHVDDTAVKLRHTPRGMDWVLGQDALAIKFRDKRGNGGSLRALLNELGQPCIILRVEHWASMSDAQLRRMDAALGAVSHGPFRCFYTMPPLTLITQALGGDLPTEPVTLYFLLPGAEATMMVTCDEGVEAPAACVEFQRKIRGLVDRGFLKNWHRVRLVK
jgi:hypothetical protein